MRIVLDTNVFVSGVFFRGPPYEILKAWQDDRFQLVISQEILQEYREVGEALAKRFSGVDLSPIWAAYCEGRIDRESELA